MNFLWRAAGLGVTLLCVAIAPVAVAPEREIVYGTDPAQRLDLFPASVPKFPTVLFVHGGGLVGGDKGDQDYQHVCEPFAAAGMGCANVNYRLLPATAWPAPAQDVAAAVAWTRSHIAARGGDPDRLFLMGHSSGAMLVALLGSDERFLAAAGLKSSAVRGVIPMGSIMWDEDLEQSIAKNGVDQVTTAFARDPRGRQFGSLEGYRSQWPMRHLRSGMPPFLFLIAESERINPPVLMTNRKFVDEARALGNEAEFRVLAGRTHYSAIRPLHQAGDSVFTLIADWIRTR